MERIIDSRCVHGVAGGNMQVIRWHSDTNRRVMVRGFGRSEAQEYRVGTFTWDTCTQHLGTTRYIDIPRIPWR